MIATMVFDHAETATVLRCPGAETSFRFKCLAPSKPLRGPTKKIASKHQRSPHLYSVSRWLDVGVLQPVIPSFYGSFFWTLQPFFSYHPFRFDLPLIRNKYDLG